MINTIVVTGALGNVGSEVIRALLTGPAAPDTIRAADLNPEAINARFGGRVRPVAFDFAKPDTYRAAFDGARALFLMRPPQISDARRLIIPAIEAARTAGVEHVVFLSLIGIEKTPFVPHYAIEQHLRASPLRWTFLRASFFMQNLSTTHRDEIRLRNEIAVPAGRSRTSFVDVRDIGAAAACVLTAGDSRNRIFELTGPEALDYWQAAEVLSHALGRQITYTDPNPAAFLFRQVKRGLSWQFALVMTGLYLATRLGQADRVTDDLRLLTGRPAATFSQYASDYRQAWLPDQPAAAL